MAAGGSPPWPTSARLAQLLLPPDSTTLTDASRGSAANASRGSAANASRGSAANSNSMGDTAIVGAGRLSWKTARKNASNHNLAPSTMLSSPIIVIDAARPPAPTGPHPTTNWRITNAKPTMASPVPQTSPRSRLNVLSTHSDTRLDSSIPMLFG